MSGSDGGTLLAEVTRGGLPESLHHGMVAVVSVDGSLIAQAGDVERIVFFRSSAKPFQAIPLVKSGAADAAGFTAADLALCCASHHAEPRHQRRVADMLAKAGLRPEDLQCGISLPSDDDEAARVHAGLVPRSPLQCDCSGKHTGMLATCLHLGLPLDSYLEPAHPLQEQIHEIMAELLRLPATEIHPGTDGCGLPTFGAPLRSFAAAYATLGSPARAPADAGRAHAPTLDRLRRAMIAHPENVAGTGGLGTTLMTVAKGRIAAKGGAEALFCFAVPERGLGVALRVLDGAARSLPAITGAVLAQLDLLPPAMIAALAEHHPPVVRTHTGKPVGEIRATFRLSGEGRQ